MNRNIGDQIRVRSRKYFKSLPGYNLKSGDDHVEYEIPAHGGSYSVGFTEDMFSFCGRIVTISSIEEDPSTGQPVYRIEKDRDNWAWWEWMVEDLIKEKLELLENE